jgi:hypothetical protein
MPPGEDAEDPRYQGSLLPGYLRTAGALQLSHRHPVAVAPDLLPTVRAVLFEHLPRSRNADPAWIEACHCKAITGPLQTHVTCLLLTKRQRIWLGQRGINVRVAAPTGQTLEATLLGVDGDLESVSLEYRQQLLDIPDLDLVPPLYQLGSGYPRRAAFDNPYSCVLNPASRDRLGMGYCLISNPSLEQAYPGLVATIAALPEYDEVVPTERVLLDATLALSIGIRFGELCTIAQLSSAPSRTSRRVFRYRHSICRVGRTGTSDMEKPLARLPQEVFDGIGIEGGAQVVIEGVTSQRSGAPEITRIKLRGLPIREPLLPFTPDAPDYFDETGSLDLPIVQLDLIRRRALGLVQGSAVYVRPGLPSIVAAELTSVLLLLAAAIVGSISASSLWLSVVLVVVYLVFVLWMTVRKFR